MRAYLWKMFGGSLGLTIATELAVVMVYLFLERLRERARQADAPGESGRGEKASRQEMVRHTARIFLLAVLLNVLTNPPAVLACWLGRLWLRPRLQMFLQLGVEAAVVAVEGILYGRFGEKPGWEIRRPLLLSLAANGTSWLLGLWLNGCILTAAL